MPKDTISLKLELTPEIYRIILRRQAKEKEKRCRVFSLQAAALKILEESETNVVSVSLKDSGIMQTFTKRKNK